MARYRGRVVVLKVDSAGVKIKNYKSWRKTNPDKPVWDSLTEWSVWKYMQDNNIVHTAQVTVDLYPGVVTREFQMPRQTKLAKKEGRSTREIKEVSQQGISYTPDYYLPDLDVYIEVKGFADELFKMRWKLFKLKGFNGFIVYSVKEFEELYTQLIYEKSLLDDNDTN